MYNCYCINTNGISNSSIIIEKLGLFLKASKYRRRLASLIPSLEEDPIKFVFISINLILLCTFNVHMLVFDINFRQNMYIYILYTKYKRIVSSFYEDWAVCWL